MRHANEEGGFEPQRTFVTPSWEHDIYSDDLPQYAIDQLVHDVPEFEEGLRAIINTDSRTSTTIANIFAVVDLFETIKDNHEDAEKGQSLYDTARLGICSAIVSRLTEHVILEPTVETLRDIQTAIIQAAPTLAVRIRMQAHFDKYIPRCITSLEPTEQRIIIEELASTSGVKHAMSLFIQQPTTEPLPIPTENLFEALEQTGQTWNHISIHLKDYLRHGKTEPELETSVERHVRAVEIFIDTYVPKGETVTERKLSEALDQVVFISFKGLVELAQKYGLATELVINELYGYEETEEDEDIDTGIDILHHRDKSVCTLAAEYGQLLTTHIRELVQARKGYA